MIVLLLLQIPQTILIRFTPGGITQLSIIIRAPEWPLSFEIGDNILEFRVNNAGAGQMGLLVTELFSNAEKVDIFFLLSLFSSESKVVGVLKTSTSLKTISFGLVLVI